MIPTYFITGTDTDCGKTYATVALLDYLQQQNKMGRAIKPVASGCHYDQNNWVNADIQQLTQANGAHPAPICQWTLRSAISPNLAAAEEGVTITTAQIKAFYQAYPKSDLDYLLIEGAGGLLVPLNEQETWIDFLVQTRIPVILVVGMRLGCMNHALLTAYALQKHHIPCHGWIANFLDPTMLASAENLATLQRWLNFPLLGTIAYQGTFCSKSGIGLGDKHR